MFFNDLIEKCYDPKTATDFAWQTPDQLLRTVKRIGTQLREADKMNFVVPNTVKRVLHVIREACKELRLEQEKIEEAQDEEDDLFVSQPQFKLSTPR